MGAVLEVGLAMLVMPTLGWPGLLGLSALPALIFVLAWQVRTLTISPFPSSFLFPLPSSLGTCGGHSWRCLPLIETVGQWEEM